ncbi:YhcN/YlaJ family sporulation lipoprotein [Domibacillus aminovorans]|nr:YhcN/YlaJ family sporulation lipoprotein [Domibacillus aminovorans]
MMGKFNIYITVCLTILTLIGCNNKERVAENEKVVVEETSDKAIEEKVAGDEELQLELPRSEATRIADMKQIEQAHVIIQGHKAYVALVLNDTAEAVPVPIEEKISDLLMDEDPQIEEVFVSAKPEFVKYMAEFEKRLTAGEPSKDFIDEFGNTVRKIFPNT